jgi:hypothetical protein
VLLSRGLAALQITAFPSHYNSVTVALALEHYRKLLVFGFDATYHF